MALVPWVYNNPRIDRSACRKLTFTFQKYTLQTFQDIKAEINLSKNTGLKLWDGAYLLARHLEDERYFDKLFWTGKRCIELGAGCGLVGLAAYLLGANVTLTDLKEVIDHTDICVTANVESLVNQGFQNSSNNIRCKDYCWGEDPSHLMPPFDVILGSDIIYNQEGGEYLLRSLPLLRHSTSKIVLTYKPRGLGEDIILDMLKKEHPTIKTIPVENHPPDFQGSDYNIFHL